MSRRLFEVLGVAAVLLLLVLLLKFARAPLDARATAGRHLAGDRMGQPDLRDLDQAIANRCSGRRDSGTANLLRTRNGRNSITRSRTLSGANPTRTAGHAALNKMSAVATARRFSPLYLPVGRRTSMIVDPPDGRIPALTAQEQKKRSDLRVCIRPPSSHGCVQEQAARVHGLEVRPAIRATCRNALRPTSWRGSSGAGAAASTAPTAQRIAY